MSNIAAIKYLLSSNYRVEAHLRKQYHDKHNELVFGFSLDARRSVSGHLKRSANSATHFETVAKYSDVIADFLQEEFGRHFCRMPPGWAKLQLDHATAGGQHSFKPRDVYVARNKSAILAAALCVRKRGGSSKLLLVSKTDNQEALGKLVACAETAATASRKHRKMYALVSTSDLTLHQVFFGRGYAPEGILDRPYRSGDDMLVFAKMVVG